ncbi:MAG: UDP-N-acetylglucosamine 1-carboxyvinyltransferase [Clostridiales bacterium]|nr:UDP-N-acetylglucosamine 1-carboxyvinyltransferase [Clostridiales bacterium]
MDSIFIKGGRRMEGVLDISSAKNSLLPLLAASIMCDGYVQIKKCTRYTDVNIMLQILDDLGCKVEANDDEVQIDCTSIHNYYIKEEYSRKVRSSIFMLGSLLTKFKRAKVAYPGGCNIGSRPIDLHLKGLRALNVKIEEKHGYIYCDGSNMRSSIIHLDFPSVGATENVMMASVLLKGTTMICNCACEPEIEDLQDFLNSMGAKVAGAGTSTIIIEGVASLHSTSYTPYPDRIITGTYMIACAMTKGNIRLNGVVPEHNFALIGKLKQAGCRIRIGTNWLEIMSNKQLKSIPKIETQTYPGFPTDLQNQILVLQTISRGVSVVTENLFETRFKIVNELVKMGADVTIHDKSAIVRGVPQLYGATVTASDLRGGAGLVIAGLVAKDYTTINDVEHIDRGYKAIEEDLCRLNVDIKRIHNNL